ncbi:MAG: type IV conjugative transfer system protein TraL [Proteobacteria bacterium]|nr:type IV conjugative transfer system protein TraL [Pseudomonadota bacterium]
MSYRIPQTLDEPMKFMLWTIDELIAFLVPFLVLMLVLNSPVWGMITGSGALFGIKKLKGEAGHYFMYHWMYWHMPTCLKLKITPPSYWRELIG